ncbi:MAG: peptide-methionine (S)-S-oxide reductase MsrA [Myxococcales bacterium]|nr:peptide-methionine (S)-S-oxide reductase MsrA [Myxococcales bacterium]
MKRPSGKTALSLIVVSAIVALAFWPSATRVDAGVVLPAPTADLQRVSKPALDTAIFAGGCFWGIEGVFEHVKGVRYAESGYTGGSVVSPSYEQVSSGDTGHAEAVRVVYDASQVSYGQLLQIFFSVAHDPTQLNRQGPDHGTQYRSALFYRTAEQKRIAEAYVAQLTAAKTFSRPIVTQIVPLRAFYMAEAYHQDYMAHNPRAYYIVVNDAPKVEHLREKFPALYKQ